MILRQAQDWGYSPALFEARGDDILPQIMNIEVKRVVRTLLLYDGGVVVCQKSPSSLHGPNE